MTWRLIVKLSFISAVFLLTISYSPLNAREGRIKVGVYDNAPIVFQGDDGKFRGFSVDVLEYIALKENWDLEYVFGAFSDCIDRLEKGEIDIQVYIAYSKERAQKYDFTHELLLSNWGTVYAWRGSGIETLLDLEGKTVALMSKSIHPLAFKKLIKDFGIQVKIIDIDNHTFGFKLVEEKKADAVVVNRIFGLTNARNYKIEKTNIIFNPIEIRYAMPKDKNRDLGIAIDKHIKLLKANKDSIFYKSFNKAFGFEEAFFPVWIKWSLAIGTGLFCLFFGISIFLKTQVKKKTQALTSEIIKHKETEKSLWKSEERYALAQRAANIGSWDWDILSNCLEWSSQTYPIFGLDPEKNNITYKAFLQCIHPENREFVENSIRASIDEDQDYAVEHRIVRPDGTVRWVSESGDVIRDDKGRAIRMLGIVQDITRRKQSEKMLQIERDNLRNIFESIKDGIYIINQKYIIQYVNPVLGKDFGPFENMKCYRYFHDRDDVCPWCKNLDVQKGRTIQWEWYSSKNGKTYDLLDTPIKLPDGSIGKLEIFRDITDRKKIEAELKDHRKHLEESVKQRTEELKQKTDKIEDSRKALTYLVEDVNLAGEELRKVNMEFAAANQELKEFAYIVSHDLKAPLRAISQLTHWVSQDYSHLFDDDGKMQMDLIIKRVKRMDRLIDGILRYSRVGRIREKEESLDLNLLANEVIDTLAPPDHIKIIIKNKLPVVVRDSIRMEQVFQNLIGNAIKFIDKDEGFIKVGCTDEDAFWKFSISDNGPGIDKRYHDKIFQIFQTLTARDEHESTGIGLTLVKKIIGLYGGSVWVESQTGQGATFFFTLPIKGEKHEKL